MDIQTRVATSVGVLVGLILLAMGLRRLGLVQAAQGPLFSALVTQVTLPALIFVSLARSVLHWDFALLALMMLVAEIASLAVAWLGGRGLRLASPQLGALMLVAAFGSSSLLGYALVSQVYAGDSQAIAEAVVISELGVGPALFILGTMIALYYGSVGAHPAARMAQALKFFRSPIFISVVAGLLWSLLSLPTDGPYIAPLFQALEVVGSANTFVAAMAVGVLLHLQGITSMLGLALLAGVIKLIVKPVMVWLPAMGLGLGGTEVEILVLEAAMPSALLTVVLASRYGCDANLAARLVFATSIASIGTVVAMFRLLA